MTLYRLQEKQFIYSSIKWYSMKLNWILIAIPLSSQYTCSSLIKPICKWCLSCYHCNIWQPCSQNVNRQQFAMRDRLHKLWFRLYVGNVFTTLDCIGLLVYHCFGTAKKTVQDSEFLDLGKTWGKTWGQLCVCFWSRWHCVNIRNDIIIDLLILLIIKVTSYISNKEWNMWPGALCTVHWAITVGTLQLLVQIVVQYILVICFWRSMVTYSAYSNLHCMPSAVNNTR